MFLEVPHKNFLIGSSLKCHQRGSSMCVLGNSGVEEACLVQIICILNWSVFPLSTGWAETEHDDTWHQSLLVPLMLFLFCFQIQFELAPAHSILTFIFKPHPSQEVFDVLTQSRMASDVEHTTFVRGLKNTIQDLKHTWEWINSTLWIFAHFCQCGFHQWFIFCGPTVNNAECKLNFNQTFIRHLKPDYWGICWQNRKN